MRAIPAAEVRERFLRFFEERGHTRHPSDSLVPANDPTLLFTGAGMNQFKDMFLGRGSLPFQRATTAQKCLRVPDLENVGATPRHHTFFEMLGHFSFGDYFKKECIAWEWEFFTKELGFPGDRLVVTVYEDDDEAYSIWHDEIGIPAERIYRFGEKENFWPAEAPSKGPNGPCGPCSELYWDKRPGEPFPSNDGLQDLPDDRFVEVGNCVFTQFDRQDGGKLEPLPQKNIDVGLGLERIVAVLAGVETNFETDLFEPYLAHLGRVTGTPYGQDPKADVRMRRIADHVRAVVFCITDGALPGNEGRGYVVRKILRRAVRDGYELGIDRPFLHDMVDVVGEVMGDAYHQVREHAAQCRSLIKSEEEGFSGVYRQGMNRLDAFLAERRGAPHGEGARAAELAGSGEFAFQLHDTYGFPVDITRQVLLDHGYRLDEAGFEAAMEEQRSRARAASATADAVFAENAAMVLRDAGVATTEFVGYESLQAESTVVGLLDANDASAERLAEGDEGSVVVASTPFYAQGGGQVGDRGSIGAASGRAAVADTTSLDGFYLHRVRVTSGALAVGDAVSLAVDEDARRATERNHTATHLLHAALKNQLGEHVSQAGSEVSPDRLRFDYTHGERLGTEQIRKLEDEVNRVVLRSIAVAPELRSLDEARSLGFVAMFGEKYGDVVRTLSVGDYSRELCGGTHVADSAQIGPFRIVSDSAISAGTRRIEAVTGARALELAQSERATVETLAKTLKVQVPELHERVESLVAEAKRLKKELAAATAVDVGKVLEALEREVQTAGDQHWVVFRADGLQMKEAQDLLKRAQKKHAPLTAVVFSVAGDDVLVVAAVDGSQTGSTRAGDLVKELAGMLGGGGGGRPEMAQGKGRDAGQLDAAIGKAREILAAAVGG